MRIKKERQPAMRTLRGWAVSVLQEAGAIRIEKRQGETHDYSVVIIDWNHPDVQAANAA